jgi:glycosyltransferase involved in cell wall biosynthesis
VIRRVGVVIPARDEEQLIGACLESVRAASAALGPRVTTSIIVVADGCLDATAAVAAAVPGVRVLEIESSNVGTARGVGAREAMRRGADWIANTDADSRVPIDWLTRQLRLAQAGVDVVIGGVRPDVGDLSAQQIAAWVATHPVGRPNGHIHGANLGVRAEAYRAVGGYRTLPEHEDVDLVERLALAGFDLVALGRGEVLTSGRPVGRTPGGYARFLREDLLAPPA